MTTKTKQEKTVCLFDAGAIEFAVTSSIKKNTLPEIRDSWKNWLDSYSATNLETDQDFADAAKFVAECKRTEEKLGEIREKALKGDVSKVIKEIETMQETTRQKRLEFNRAVEQRKDKLKGDAVAAALKQVAEALAAFPYRRQPRNMSEMPDAMLFAAIKGKSAILKMQEALEQESARIIAEAKAYSDTFQVMLVQISGLYQAAGETATDSELDMLVKTHFTDAPERAKLILQQKKVARDQAELDRKNKELEAAKAAPAQPEPVQAQYQDDGQRGAGPLGMTIKLMRVGATFNVANEATVRARIESIGGTDVKFVDMKAAK